MNEEEKWKQARMWLSEATNIVVLTGAGISTASGIPDFRSTGGLWASGERREDFISRYYYNRNPKDFWKRYKEIFELKLMGNYEANAGHRRLAEWDKVASVTVLTQNVDGLHKKAGSENVLELHGTIQTATCPKCKTVYDLPFLNGMDVPRCTSVNGKGKACHLILKPDVVLFGDIIKEYKLATQAVKEADVLIVMGSSLLVAPVNGFPVLAGLHSAKTILVNRESTKLDEHFDVKFLMEIDEWFNQLDKKTKNTPR